MLDTKLKKAAALFGFFASLLIILTFIMWLIYSNGSWYHNVYVKGEGEPRKLCLKFTGRSYPFLEARMESPGTPGKSNEIVISVYSKANLLLNSISTSYHDELDGQQGLGGNAWFTLNPFTSKINYRYEVITNKSENDSNEIATQYVENGLEFKWQDSRCE